MKIHRYTSIVAKAAGLVWTVGLVAWLFACEPVSPPPPQSPVSPLPRQISLQGKDSYSASTPELVKKVAPVYPEEAAKANVTGEVILEVEVDTDGSTKVTKLLKSLGYGCDEAAIEAVEAWEWTPGEVDGEPVESGGILTVSFPPESIS